MRYFSVLWLVFTVCACVTVAPAGPAVQVNANGATVQAADLESKTIALVDSDRGVFCSGVWVAADRILTANHCVADIGLGAEVDYSARVDKNGEDLKTIRRATLFQRDAAHDLALLTTAVPPLHGIADVGEDPYVGEASQSEGHSLGFLMWSYGTGVVSGVRKGVFSEYDSNTWWVQSTAPISPGNSGGGLFDAYGELIGICHGHFVSGQSLNFWIHVTHVRAFLKASK